MKLAKRVYFQPDYYDPKEYSLICSIDIPFYSNRKALIDKIISFLISSEELLLCEIYGSVEVVIKRNRMVERYSLYQKPHKEELKLC